MLPTDAPEPLGKFAVTISYYDANLHHNVLIRRSVTGILHLVNKLLLTGTLRSKLQSKQLHVVLNFLQLEPVQNKSLI